MEKPHPNIRLVWIGEASLWAVLTIAFAIALLAYLSYFLKIELVGGVPNEMVILSVAVGIGLFFAALFFAWAALRYRKYGYSLDAEAVTVQDGTIFTRRASIPYEKVENAYVGGEGLTGLLQRVLGIQAVSVVSKEKGRRIQICGVPEGARVARSIMDRSIGKGRTGNEPAQRPTTEEILREIASLRSLAESRENGRGKAAVPEAAAVAGASQPAGFGLSTGSGARRTLREVVGSTLLEEEPRGLKCVKGKGNIEVCYPVIGERTDEVLKFSSGSVPKRGGSAIRGIFSKEKAKKSIDGI